ncbi:protein prenyltransferase alpha subunit repeat-containing protein 1 isoform X1 [Sinocyclocheilus rhinocerous]|uniref:Protein prenyltransferase alpha subunit repeat-containing protein 1 n=1 Tax=Sinocyclocheilus rhinocerous TaxID=307959 RepID=A0A673LTK3_9TELE|nr:PREDICTED: protein prenyltransferase alpha subunit repeat-containing protein 1 isoform X1 [Sinocyclocheilus rhinocerous]
MAESEEEVDVLVQRVVKDINNAFKRNPNIDEIGLIPCPEVRYNRSPIVLVENKLGVESWCVKFLLPCVHNKLLLYRQRKQWLDREALVDITCTLLLLNPDFTTAWNVRKELLQCGVLNPEKDLYLVKLALSKHPKSPETWIHRRWVLQWLQKECSPSEQELKDHAEPREDAARRQCERLQRALQEEMRVCADAAGRYPSNYNAWSHRIWVLQNMAKGNRKVLHDELSSTRLWVSMHVSDHSGFHYRQHLLKALARELSQVGETELHPTKQPNGESTAGVSDDNHHNDVIPQLFHEEMELCTDLIESYPGHETLWCHRRHVFYLWHQWWREHLQGAGSQSPPLTHTDVLLSEEPCDDSSTSQTMDVDCVLDGSKHGSYTQDTKRLKRGPLLPHPTLPSEHTFVSRILTGCRSTEQNRFAIAYRKWLDSIIAAKSPDVRHKILNGSLQE